MSKIDEFNKANETYICVKRNLYNALGLDKEGNKDSNNDKHSLYIRFVDIDHGDWNNAILQLHASYGYYGSSSGYSAMNSDVAKYMAQSLKNHIKDIAMGAIELARIDAEEARKTAKYEAELVLQEI
jgi:hypothetical protein